MQRAAQEWKERLPTLGLLSHDVVLSRDGLRIRDFRIGAAKGRMVGWHGDAAEPVATLYCHRLEVTPPRHVDLNGLPLATVSLHAMARRLERAVGIADDDVLLDLVHLAGAADPWGEAGFEFEATAGHSGAWAGEMIRMPDSEGQLVTVAAARTFLGPGQQAARRGDGRRRLGSGRGWLLPALPVPA